MLQSIAHRKNTLIWILALALIARLIAAATSQGFDHPNEIYRLLEPIAHLDGYSARLPWEWTDGLLSWMPINFFRGILLGLRAVGLDGPLTETFALKVIWALLSLLPIVATWKLCAHRPRVALVATLFLALWPEWIYRSIRLMDYGLESAVLALGVIWLTSPGRSKNLGLGAGLGMCLGAVFFMRFQSALWLVLILGVLLWEGFVLKRRTSLHQWLVLALSSIVTVCGISFLELALNGTPWLSPFFNYWRFNFIDSGAARFYGADPWHRYLSELFKFYGYAPALALLVGAVLCLSRLKTQPQKQLQKEAQDQQSIENVTLASLIFWVGLIVYSLIAHKEERFILGFQWLLVPLGCLGLESLFISRFISRLDSRRGRIIAAFVLIIGLGVQSVRLAPRWTQHNDDVRDAIALGQASGDSTTPLVIDRDPDVYPGGFYLRTRRVVCYGSTQSSCTPPTRNRNSPHHAHP